MQLSKVILVKGHHRRHPSQTKKEQGLSQNGSGFKCIYKYIYIYEYVYIDIYTLLPLHGRDGWGGGITFPPIERLLDPIE